jgi:hypothetical protein
LWLILVLVLKTLMDELLQALRVSSPHLDTTKVPFDASGNHVSIVHLVASISKTQLGTVKKFIKKYENHECMRLLKPHVLKGSSAYMLSGDAQATAHALSHWPSPKVKNVCQNLPSDASGPVPMETEVPVVAQDQRSTQAASCTIARKPLVLNGITIEVDPQTLMVNATQMCSAAGKFYAHYSTTIGMTEYKNALSSAIGIPIAELIKCKNGNREGTMVHRRVALYLAQKLSPVFAVQVTGWLEELFTTGRVELGKEATNEELNQKWEQRVKDLFAAHSSERALSCDDEEDRRIKRRRDDMAFEDERNRKNILFNEELKQKALLAAEELNKQTALNAEELKKQAALTAEELNKQTALTAEEFNKQTALNAEELKKQTALTAEELKKQAALTAEELKKQTALTAEELKKQAALAAEELNERKQRTLLAEEELKKQTALTAEVLKKQTALTVEELKKQAALTAEELKKKSLEISNEKITMMLNLEKDITPFLQKQISSCDAHIMSKSKDVYLAMVTQIKNFVTGDSEVAGVIKYCKDITSIARELGFRSLTQGEKTSIGVMIATEYLSRTGQAPLKIVKDVNGADREVNTYHEEHDVWIRPLIQKRLDEMRGTRAPPMSQRNPSATINKYFSTQ